MAEELENKAENKSDPDNKGAEDKSAENQNDKDEKPKTEAEIRAEVVAELKVDEHKESSKLGRRISAMEESMTSFIENANTVLSSGNKPQQEDQISDTDYMTVGDFKKIQTQQSVDSQNANLIYGKTYVKHIKDMGDRENIPEEVHLQAMKLTTDDDGKFNKTSHKDPSAAAEINYYQALNYIQAQAGKPGSTRKADQDLPPSGDATTNSLKKVDDIELDDETKEYAKRRGISLEKAKELLNDKTPIYSSGGQRI